MVAWGGLFVLGMRWVRMGVVKWERKRVEVVFVGVLGKARLNCVRNRRKFAIRLGLLIRDPNRRRWRWELRLVRRAAVVPARRC